MVSPPRASSHISQLVSAGWFAKVQRRQVHGTSPRGGSQGVLLASYVWPEIPSAAWSIKAAAGACSMAEGAVRLTHMACTDWEFSSLKRVDAVRKPPGACIRCLLPGDAVDTSAERFADCVAGGGGGGGGRGVGAAGFSCNMVCPGARRPRPLTAGLLAPAAVDPTSSDTRPPFPPPPRREPCFRNTARAMSFVAGSRATAATSSRARRPVTSMSTIGDGYHPDCPE